MKNHLVRSLEAGAIAAMSFFVLTLLSFFMVFGDGTAPVFTHAMLWLNEFPFHLFSAKVSKSMVLVGTAFWGLTTFAIVFICSLLVGSKK